MNKKDQIPKVSIILPVYNAEKYIAKAILSILSQTFSCFELIVVIDGSPDKSSEIVESFADNRIKKIEKENGGLSDARNVGLSHARGEYIFFMDPDDWIEPGLLQENIKILDENNLNFIVFGFIIDNYNNKNKLISSKEFGPRTDALIRGESDINLDNYHLSLLGYATNKIYRRELISKPTFRFKKGVSLIEDVLFNVPVFLNSQKIMFNRKCYYHYNVRSEPTLSKSFRTDAFNLRLLKNENWNAFLTAWNVKNKSAILSQLFFKDLIISILELFNFKNTLNKNQKKEYIHIACTHPMFISYKSYFKPKGWKNILYYKLIVSRNVTLLSAISSIKSIFYLKN